MMHLKRSLTGLLVLGLTAMPSVAGVTITPMQGSLGNPFSNGTVHGWGWNGVQGGGAGPLIGNIYDNILTINGGAATAGFFGPFGTFPGTQGFFDWAGTQAQMGDDLHGLAGPARGGPTAVVTSIRYGYIGTLGTATHTIQVYDMIPPSADHPHIANDQFGALLTSIVVPGFPSGTAAFVTVTDLSIHMGAAVWIKFGASGLGSPGTFWLVGGVANGVGTSHFGALYDNKNYYGPGLPLHYFDTGYFCYQCGSWGIYIATNIQVALSGFIIPAPAAISLLGLGGLMTLHRRRSR